jgi:hypothetical protein
MKTKTYSNIAERQDGCKTRFGNDPGNMTQISPRTVTREERRALELLAACQEGITEALMQAHGFTIPLMVKLARAGLVRVLPVRVNGIEFARLKISDDGRAALTAPKTIRINKVSGMSRNEAAERGG